MNDIDKLQKEIKELRTIIRIQSKLIKDAEAILKEMKKNNENN